MAITRTQIAKQLLANGGRTGFQQGGKRGNTGQASQSVSDSFGRAKDVGGSNFGQFERRQIQNETLKNAGFLNRDLGINVGPQKNIFQRAFDNSLLGRITGGLAEAFKNAPPATTDNILGKKGGGLDLPLWARLGFSSQEDYEAALRDQMLMADGGRIGFQQGGKRGNTGQASQSVSDSSGDGVGGQGGKRGDFGQASINLSRNFDVGGGGPKGPPTIVGGGGLPKSFLVADALTTPTAGQFGFNLMDLKRLKDAGYDPEEVSEGGYGEDLLKALQPITLADGGRAGLAGGGMPYEGGIMDLETGRQQYFLGKLVKKVGRTVKKIAKSPIGKAALLYAGGTFLGGLQGFGGAGLGSRTFLSNLKSGQGIANLGGFLKGKLLDSATTKPGTDNKGILSKIFSSPTTLITGASAVAGLLTPEQEAEAQKISDETGIPIETIRANPDEYLAIAFRAEGGRIGYQEGSKEPVAKKTMPLLDMDGKEMDLRAEGGFVPIGRMEKADDVPARLSKNEFVFTADAVRNAGEGDVDKGAEVMYNMMKNLESGGEVSEESQGLEGARKMFQTSQRLEEVL